MRQADGVAPGPVRRIRELQRLSGLQIHQAEHHRHDVPKCKEGEIAEKKARRGNIFYSCTNYPKCDFTANHKPVDQKCPECGSAYVMEKTLKSGVYLVCPNRRAGEDEKPKRKGKKAAEDGVAEVVCHYQERIGDAPAPAEQDVAVVAG
jgi:DNA topoisomerase-1